MKNYLFIVFILISLISCGKKGDPEFKANEGIQNYRTII